MTSLLDTVVLVVDRKAKPLLESQGLLIQFFDEQAPLLPKIPKEATYQTILEHLNQHLRVSPYNPTSLIAALQALYLLYQSPRVPETESCKKTAFKVYRECFVKHGWECWLEKYNGGDCLALICELCDDVIQK